MGRRQGLICALAALVVIVTLGACGGGAEEDSNKTTLAAHLTGDQVAPGPGDENGAGDATITIGEQLGTICYAYSLQFVDQPTGVKLGNGNPGDFGAMLVTLASGAQGSPGGCVSGIDQAVIRGIKLLPASYYVEIDTASFPEGAVRGQLAKQ